MQPTIDPVTNNAVYSHPIRVYSLLGLGFPCGCGLCSKPAPMLNAWASHAPAGLCSKPALMLNAGLPNLPQCSTPGLPNLP